MSNEHDNNLYTLQRLNVILCSSQIQSFSWMCCIECTCCICLALKFLRNQTLYAQRTHCSACSSLSIGMPTSIHSSVCLWVADYVFDNVCFDMHGFCVCFLPRVVWISIKWNRLKHGNLLMSTQIAIYWNLESDVTKTIYIGHYLFASQRAADI